MEKVSIEHAPRELLLNKGISAPKDFTVIGEGGFVNRRPSVAVTSSPTPHSRPGGVFISVFVFVFVLVEERLLTIREAERGPCSSERVVSYLLGENTITMYSVLSFLRCVHVALIRSCTRMCVCTNQRSPRQSSVSREACANDARPYSVPWAHITTFLGGDAGYPKGLAIGDETGDVLVSGGEYSLEGDVIQFFDVAEDYRQ